MVILNSGGAIGTLGIESFEKFSTICCGWPWSGHLKSEKLLVVTIGAEGEGD